MGLQMQTIKSGDYFLTKNTKTLFRIVNVFSDNTGTYVDIKKYIDLKGHYKNLNDYAYIRALPVEELDLIGTVISEEKASKIIKLLYD